jgi:hypothetical protein
LVANQSQEFTHVLSIASFGAARLTGQRACTSVTGTWTVAPDRQIAWQQGGSQSFFNELPDCSGMTGPSWHSIQMAIFASCSSDQRAVRAGSLPVRGRPLGLFSFSY